MATLLAVAGALAMMKLSWEDVSSQEVAEATVRRANQEGDRPGNDVGGAVVEGTAHDAADHGFVDLFKVKRAGEDHGQRGAVQAVVPPMVMPPMPLPQALSQAPKGVMAGAPLPTQQAVKTRFQVIGTWGVGSSKSVFVTTESGTTLMKHGDTTEDGFMLSELTDDRAVFKKEGLTDIVFSGLGSEKK